MAAKKAQKGKGGGGKSKSNGATITAVPVKGASSSSFFLSAVPGIIVAVAVALYYRAGNGGSGGPNTSSAQPSYSSRELLSPKPGTWTEGYYTTEPVPSQAAPSTHALLYPNGGAGEPEPVSFSNEEEFLGLGRLYNDLGQIVQSPWHFRNGTALYKGPDKPGTHFQWPAGEH